MSSSDLLVPYSDVERFTFKYVDKNIAELKKKYGGKLVAFLVQGEDCVEPIVSGNGFPNIRKMAYSEIEKRFNGKSEKLKRQIGYCTITAP
jgi:hypothetical protein